MRNMRASTFLFKLFTILLICRSRIHITYAQPNFSCHNCYDTNGNYTIGSIYGTNLKTALATLSSNAGNENGYYYTVSVGQDPDRVYGIAVCRADRAPKDCQGCVSSAVAEFTYVCPVQKEAIGYYTGDCMVRYSNRPIFNLRENSPNCTVPQAPNNVPASDLRKVRKSLADLLAGLKLSASAGNSSYKFSSGDVEVTDSITLYGLAQCNPVLPSVECSDCLGLVMSRLQQCCANLNGINVNGPICSVAFANYPVLWNYNDSSPQPNLPGTSVRSGDRQNRSGKRGNNARKTWIIVVGVVSLMLIGVAFFGLLRRKMRKEHKQEDSYEDMKLDDLSSLDFNNIQLATDNFSNSKRLDHGGSTAMYKGQLPDGQEILVKRLDKGGTEEELEFDKEVLLSANLQHKNLVKLLSFCVEKDSRILVYELLHNGSLEGFLNDPVKRASLNWQTRYHIISGLARGLLYLHEDSQVRVIHRDLKPSNILLDEQMNPKISNFKTARLIHGGQNEEDTRVVGTYGYMPLEYVQQGYSSIKSDIFSYGVILLEVVTGYMISGFSDGDAEENLLTYALKKWCDDTTLDMVDEALDDVERHEKEIKRCIKIGLLCVQEDQRHRPTMSNVVLMLNSDTVDVANPIVRPSPLILNNMDLHSLSSSTETLKSREFSIP
ncbi:hypothetical protein RND81_07G130500 [Saponaria officinalis]|uniref:Uncharacterized protein n=1 Tax=Saponaria officinalis TaxID=3572 RepID=A0AAW1JS13_SAPOF